MRELRLVPAALCVWGAAIAVIVVGPWAALGLVAAVMLALLLWREPGQAIFTGGIGVCSVALAWWRVAVAQGFNAHQGITGMISGMPKEPVSYTHLTLPTTLHECRSRWSPYH